jgi:hypothetical protein
MDQLYDLKETDSSQKTAKRSRTSHEGSKALRVILKTGDPASLHRCVLFCCVAAIGSNLTQCSPSPEDLYGVTYNPTRIRESIPKLDPTWTIRRREGTVFSWSKPGGPVKGHPSYFEKTMWVQKGILLQEIDSYTSGNTYIYRDPDGPPPADNFDLLSITYSYEKKRAAKDPWTYTFWNQYGNKELTREDAEALLSSWGLKRLNY